MVYPSCKILFIITLSCLVALFNRADPITFITIATVYFFSFSKGHLAVLLIQLEILALITVYAIFLAVSGNNPVLFLALLIFTVIASEGRVGLAFLLKARRQFSPEMEKRRV